MAKRTVIGPYRVKDTGVIEVVIMRDNHENTWEELRPRRTYASRQSAYRSCMALNAQWQNEHMFDNDLLTYWQEATN
jgi:hypothetical protein